MINITDYIIIIAAIFGFSVLCSFTKRGFSLGVFLTGISISICVLIWKSVLPFYVIVFPILIIIGILFGDRIGLETDETGRTENE